MINLIVGVVSAAIGIAILLRKPKRTAPAPDETTDDAAAPDEHTRRVAAARGVVRINKLDKRDKRDPTSLSEIRDDDKFFDNKPPESTEKKDEKNIEEKVDEVDKSE